MGSLAVGWTAVSFFRCDGWNRGSEASQEDQENAEELPSNLEVRRTSRRAGKDQDELSDRNGQDQLNCYLRVENTFLDFKILFFFNFYRLNRQLCREEIKLQFGKENEKFFLRAFF